MDARKLTPSPHIEAAELKGQEKTVTIMRVQMEKVGSENVDKGVVFFQEFDRGMVINKTNNLRIIDWHGEETDDWLGKQITIYPSETDFNGKVVPCIRVRPKE